VEKENEETNAGVEHPVPVSRLFGGGPTDSPDTSAHAADKPDQPAESTNLFQSALAQHSNKP